VLGEFEGIWSVVVNLYHRVGSYGLRIPLFRHLCCTTYRVWPLAVVKETREFVGGEFEGSASV